MILDEDSSIDMTMLDGFWGPPDSPTPHQSDNPLVRQPINARGISSLINILQGIPTDHEGGSYIHVPYITERRPYMSTHPFFMRVTSVMNLPKIFILLFYQT